MTVLLSVGHAAHVAQRQNRHYRDHKTRRRPVRGKPKRPTGLGDREQTRRRLVRIRWPKTRGGGNWLRRKAADGDRKRQLTSLIDRLASSGILLPKSRLSR